MPGGNTVEDQIICGVDETSCSVTGLLPSQKKAIQDSWDIVVADADTHGMELFIRLFSGYPKAKHYFSQLKDVPEEQLRSNPTLINHAQKALGAITHLVDNLQQPEEVVRSVRELARDHREMDVSPTEFKVVLQTLQTLMKDVLEEKYDNFTSRAWEECCRVIASVAEDEMNKDT